jgi:hypothetical protein
VRPSDSRPLRRPSESNASLAGAAASRCREPPLPARSSPIAHSAASKQSVAVRTASRLGALIPANWSSRAVKLPTSRSMIPLIASPGRVRTAARPITGAATRGPHQTMAGRPTCRQLRGVLVASHGPIRHESSRHPSEYLSSTDQDDAFSIFGALHARLAPRSREWWRDLNRQIGNPENGDSERNSRSLGWAGSMNHGGPIP